MSDEICDWPGRSGAMYRYWVYPLEGARFDPKPGNYIYAKQTRAGEWLPLYIGEGRDLSGKLLERDVQSCVATNGATHVHAHANPDGDGPRRVETRDLVENYQPGCNQSAARRAAAKIAAAKRKRAALWPPDFFDA
jgi:hypothetical protein